MPLYTLNAPTMHLPPNASFPHATMQASCLPPPATFASVFTSKLHLQPLYTTVFTSRPAPHGHYPPPCVFQVSQEAFVRNLSLITMPRVATPPSSFLIMQANLYFLHASIPLPKPLTPQRHKNTFSFQAPLLTRHPSSYVTYNTFSPR